MNDTMKQVYLLAQEHCGLNVGDWVKVLRKADDYEAGWDNTWLGTKSEMVGTTCQIRKIDVYGIWLPYFEKEFLYGFPYFCLKKVEKPAHEFKPFERVLVRDRDNEKWRCSLFSHQENKLEFTYFCITSCWRFCIPYEGNEHLVGTCNEPDNI